MRLRFPIQLSEIFRHLQGAAGLTGIRGDSTIERVSPAQNPGSNSLVFVEKTEFLPIQPFGGAVVLREELLPDLHPDIPVLVARNALVAMAVIKQEFYSEDYWAGAAHQISDQASIEPGTEIGRDVIIRAGVRIGKNVRIGTRSVILENTVIGDSVVIGENCVIHPLVYIAAGSRIGNRVEVKSGSVIGGEGFGFVRNEKGIQLRIPQTGIVVLEDDVRIGSHNTIDRAAFGETRIGRNTITDNHCHFAHNVVIGQDGVITAQVGVAGSTTLGDRVVVSGQAGFLDHLKIASDTVFLIRAGIHEDVTEPGVYAGTPLRKFSDFNKEWALIRSLDSLRKRIRALEKHLESRDQRDSEGE